MTRTAEITCDGELYRSGEKLAADIWGRHENVIASVSFDLPQRSRRNDKTYAISQAVSRRHSVTVGLAWTGLQGCSTTVCVSAVATQEGALDRQ